MSPKKTAKERLAALVGLKLPETTKDLAKTTGGIVTTEEQWQEFLKNPHSPVANCPPEALKALTASLKFKGGAIAHFRYDTIADKITFLEFLELLAAFGISLRAFARQQDYDCEGFPNGSCEVDPGGYCDPFSC